MENHEPDEVLAAAPFEQSLTRKGRDYMQYFALAHPSLPNYLAIASGDTAGKTTDDIAAGEISGSTIWDQLSAAHVSWAVYEETMPAVCSAGVSAGPSSGDYEKLSRMATTHRAHPFTARTFDPSAGSAPSSIVDHESVAGTSR